jgi:hypothetical protein
LAYVRSDPVDVRRTVGELVAVADRYALAIPAHVVVAGQLIGEEA